MKPDLVLRDKVLALIKGYVQRPDVQKDEFTMLVLDDLAGDIEVISNET